MKSVTWRALLLTQGLGVLFAVTPWLEQWGEPTQPTLTANLFRQAVTALVVMLAAFAADEYVRRGWSVLRAFAAALLISCIVSSLAQWRFDLGDWLNTFFTVGTYWGTPMLVYLNRQSAARLFATVQEGELRRVRAARRLVESDLAATEAEINPAAVLQQLGHLRDLYAAGSADADRELELLITNLRDTVARCARIAMP